MISPDSGQSPLRATLALKFFAVLDLMMIVHRCGKLAFVGPLSHFLVFGKAIQAILFGVLEQPLSVWGASTRAASAGHRRPSETGRSAEQLFHVGRDS
jgi:hypothetical protein